MTTEVVVNCYRCPVLGPAPPDSLLYLLTVTVFEYMGAELALKAAGLRKEVKRGRDG